MTVTIKVEGAITTKHEKIICDLTVPDGWNPTWAEFSKVLGAVRYLTEKLEQFHTPPTANN